MAGGAFDGARVAELTAELRQCFDSRRTRSYEWRAAQLKGIARMIEEKEADIMAALHDDLAKPQMESFLHEAIENGWLPRNILDGIPCKYYKGSVFCEVWDFRSCMSECDSSCAHSPKVQKVCLRMSTEDVVRDMQSISDDSWSYNDFLQVESQIIKALHPKLYLCPKPSLKRFFEESVSKKLNLGIKWRWTKKRHKIPEFGSKSIPTGISDSRTL